MVRILGNNLSNKKKIYIALTCIYGIGIPTSKRILNELKIDPETKVSELTEINISSLIIVVGVAYEIQKTVRSLYKNVLEEIK